MKIQVSRVAIALATAVPLALAAVRAKPPAAPINARSIKAAVPAVTTDVHYRARRGHPDASYWGYLADSSSWDYPTYD